MIELILVGALFWQFQQIGDLNSQIADLKAANSQCETIIDYIEDENFQNTVAGK